ncbi:MAG: phosphotransferase [Chloroflexota bacterium]
MPTSASWIASRPDISVADAAIALRRWWGLDGALEDLPSERDRNLLVRSMDGTPTHVLKIANLDEAAGFLACQDLAMTRLSNAGVPVQRVVNAIDGHDLIPLGDPGPPLARVLTWLPGRTLASVEAPTTDLWSDLGAVMGRTATALLDFDHPAAHRDFPWDVLRAGAVVGDALEMIDDDGRRSLLASVLDRLQGDLAPRLSTLRRSVIQNDANDHNILVSDDGRRVVGLLDFGDMIHSITAHEAAVACAYSMLGRDEPLSVMKAIIRGFVAECPLTADEVDALPALAIARLAASVAMSAQQGRLSDDPYLCVSEAPAWDLLERLHAMAPSELRIAAHEGAAR